MVMRPGQEWPQNIIAPGKPYRQRARTSTASASLNTTALPGSTTVLHRQPHL